ncbi:MAG: 3-oxoacyl-[acyl-carrier-protein] reductase [Sphaerochaetaceae bacterium]
MRKTAIVTGGSKGIGKQIVIHLLQQGMEVFYLSRSEGEGAQALCSLAKVDSSRAHWVKCDIGSSESVEQALKHILASVSRIDVLVNNAGITKDGLLMRMSEEAWDEVLSVNLKGVFLTCRAISRLMIAQRSGAIVNISSVVGLSGNGGQTNYAASKAGVIGFSKSLAKELAGRGVRVNVVAPGFIETEMTDALGAEAASQLKHAIPLGRIGSAEEVAKAVVFLCGQEASYITGQVLSVDGGMSM